MMEKIKVACQNYKSNWLHDIEHDGIMKVEMKEEMEEKKVKYEEKEKEEDREMNDEDEEWCRSIQRNPSVFRFIIITFF